MGRDLHTLLPYGYGLVAAVAIMLFAAKSFVSTLSSEAGKAALGAIKRLYLRVRPLGGRRLARYRDQVRAQNSRVRLGLSAHPDDTGQAAPGLREVYVPLQCESDRGRADAATRLREAKRTVLLGAPGAGKSLLLKREMLEWADNGDDHRIPVMVDLHSCNSTQDSFESLITRRFEDARMRGAKDLVTARLDSGELRLFFDGLDEVGTEHQERVVGALRDFVTRYGDCEVVVSCRSAAYERQLQDVFDQEVVIAEFDDASILRFLSQWPELEGPVTAARIFRALQDDPELMVLARSPLMLTMIAYLQSGDRPESVGPLPNSRAGFYDMAVAHLLDRDRLLNRSEAISKYNAGRKTLVLQRLALRQLSSSSSRGDRQEITRAQFEDVIEELLPGFDLERVPDLQQMLTEIVRRSELIKDIDRGRHYQFTHLTLLEYLAACELRTDETQLMEHYRRDPQPWRETVRMWCAVTRGDCTQVVREIFQDTDPRRRVLALQCLADAVHIDQALVEEILGHFLAGLGTPGETGQAIARGLGALAASSRPRGRRVREALVQAAREPSSDRRSGALRALTVSGRQEAAEALSRLAYREARAALRDMGDVAVPSLAQSARAGRLWAVRSLAAVGTPSAAVQLAELLWETPGARLSGTADRDFASPAVTGRPLEPRVLARTAAWHLAALMRSPDVRRALREWCDRGALREWARRSPHAHVYDWIWDPFDDDGLAVLAGRVAWLMDEGRLDRVVTRSGDVWEAGRRTEGILTLWDDVTEVYHRIGIPLFACAPVRDHPGQETLAEVDRAAVEAYETLGFRSFQTARNSLDGNRAEDLHQLFNSPEASTDAGERALRPVLDALLRAWAVPGVYRKVLEGLPWAVRVKLVDVRFGRRGTSASSTLMSKWRAVHEKPGPPKALTRVAWTAGVLFAALWVAGAAYEMQLATGLRDGFSLTPETLAALVTLLALVSGGVLTSVAAAKRDVTRKIGPYDWCGLLLGGVGLALMLGLSLVEARDVLGWPVTAAVYGLSLATAVGAGVSAARVNAKRNNPLRAPLAAAEGSTDAERTSDT